MGVASHVWSGSVQSASLQACLSSTHLNSGWPHQTWRVSHGAVHPLPPPSSNATKETIIEKKSILSKR